MKKARLELLRLLIARDIQDKYRGSVIGVAWWAISPLIMMSMYTFVFAGLIGARWGGSMESSDGAMTYGVNIFAGLIVINAISEVMGRSGSLYTDNLNYVKKVVFPLDFLNLMVTSTALAGAMVNYVILFAACVLIDKSISTVSLLIFMPVALGLLMVALFGVSLIVSTVSTLVPDLKQVIGMLVSMIMFLSPVFYPVSLLESKVGFLTWFNPATVFIEGIRITAGLSESNEGAMALAMVVYAVVITGVGRMMHRKLRWTIVDAL